MTHIIGKSNAKQPTSIGSLQFQTAERGVPIPLVYGITRVAPSIIDYTDFKATPSSAGSGKGKGGGKSGSTTTFNYSVSVLFGLCQGPIGAVTKSWADQSTFGGFSSTTSDGSGSGDPQVTTLHLGFDGQAVDDYWESAHPNQTLTYSGTAYLAWPNAQIGQSAQLPNVSFEVQSLFTGFGSLGFDANPADIVLDFLTNTRYGALFPLAFIGDFATYHIYCGAIGLGLSPQLDQQQEAQQFLADICKITNSAAVWSSGKLSIVPYGDVAAISAGAWVVQLLGTNSLHGSDFVDITINDPVIGTNSIHVVAFDGMTTPDLGEAVANELIALGVPYNVSVIAVGSESTSFNPPGQSFQVSIVLLQNPWAGGTTVSLSTSLTASFIVDIPGGQFSYTPNTTPIYDLNEDDFIVEASTVGMGQLVAGGPALRSGGSPIIGTISDDPVRVTRSTPADAMNNIQIEYLDRFNNYHAEIVEAWDQAAIDVYGLRRDTSLKGRAICDPVTAKIAAQLYLQRQILFRNTYTFRLGWKYILLEPMDIVSITDDRLGFDKKPVRITSIEEDEEGTLTIMAEEFFVPVSA